MSYYDDYNEQVRFGLVHQKPEFRDHYQLVRGVQHDKQYRANPDSEKHYSYHQACNRWFVFSLILLVIGFYPVFPDAAHAVAICGAALVGILATGFFVLKGIGALVDLIAWLSDN